MRTAYFLRKRSSRTTSPPVAGASLGLAAGFASVAGLAGVGKACFGPGVRSWRAGGRADFFSAGFSVAGSSSAACSSSTVAENCRPNWTEGKS